MAKVNEFDLNQTTDPESDEIPEQGVSDDELTGIECPKCHMGIDRVIKYGSSWNLSCPNCGAPLKKALLPDGFPIENRDPIHGKSSRQEVQNYDEPEEEPVEMPSPRQQPGPRRRPVQQYEQVEEDEEPEPTRVDTGSLFRGPKTPGDILQEVCTLHGLKQNFITYVKRASDESPEGLSPVEFAAMLKDLDAGLKTKAQAQYVIGDYQNALMKERLEEAQRSETIPYGSMSRGRGYETAYPNLRSPGAPRQRGGMEEFHAQQQMPMLNIPTDRPIRPEEVQALIMQALQASRQRDSMEMLMERVVKLESSVPQMISESMSRVESMIQQSMMPREEPDRVTMKDLQQMFALQSSEREKEMMARQMEMQNKMMEMQLASIQAAQHRTEADKAKLEAALEEARSSTPAGQLGSDQAIIISKGMDELGKAIKGREPVKEIAQAIARTAGATSAPVQIQKTMPNADITDVIPVELVERAG